MNEVSCSLCLAIVAFSAVLQSTGSVIITDPPPEPATLYTVVASASPDDGGIITGTGSFEAGTWVELTAIPSPGYALSNWTENGVVVGSSSGHAIGPIDADRNLVANFVQQQNQFGTNYGWDTRFALPTGVDGPVFATATRGNSLYVGGAFSSAGGSKLNNLARWDGQQWHAVGGGLNGPVYAMAFRGRDLYVGGQFTRAGSTPATNIAKWNGHSWEALGPGLSGARNNVIGPAAVLALAVDGKKVYAGGGFDRAGELAVVNVAKWTGSEWVSPGGGVTDGGGSAINAAVYSLAVRGPHLYVGGRFDRAGTEPASNIACWKRSGWEEIQGGVRGASFGFPFLFGPAPNPGRVYSLAFVGSRLYVAGDFSRAGPATGGISAQNLAVWSGTNWLAPDTFDGPVHKLLPKGMKLYACGEFKSINGTPAAGVAMSTKPAIESMFRLSPTSSGLGGFNTGPRWSALMTGVSGPVLTVAVNGQLVFAGGDFDVVDDVLAGCVARWDGAAWTQMGAGAGNGLVGDVAGAAIVATGNGACVFGNIQIAGDLWVNGAAQWDGEQWSTLGNGLTAASMPLKAGAVGSDVFLSGSFQVPGLELSPPWGSWMGLAKWDGVRWLGITSTLWPPHSSRILAASDNRVYTLVSRDFPFLSHLEKWNGFAWSSIPLPPAGPTEVLTGFHAAAADGDCLYVVNPGPQIMKWDGSTWTAVPGKFTGGAGTTPFGPIFLQPVGSISDMIVVNTDLYVAGDFVRIDNVAVTNLARWNGTTWSSVGDAFASSADRIASLAKLGERLYVAGSFQTIGGVSARHVAKWDGVQWAALGEGLAHSSDDVSSVSLAAFGNQLYVIGNFTRAGGKPSHRFAVWTEPEELP